MALERRTVVNQIEVTEGGILQIRFGLQIVDGGEVISQKWHRTSIPLHANPADQINTVNIHLAQMGENPVSEDDLARITAFHNLSASMSG